LGRAAAALGQRPLPRHGRRARDARPLAHSAARGWTATTARSSSIGPCTTTAGARASPSRAAGRGRRTTAPTSSRRTAPSWYLGLGLMAALEVIEWPVALVIAVGHELTYRARTRALKE